MFRFFKSILTLTALALTGYIVFNVATYDPNRNHTPGAEQIAEGGGDPFDASFNRFVESGFGQLPVKVNDQMTLTRMTSTDRNITFYFTVDVGGAEVDKRSVKRQEPAMKQHFCSNPLFKALKSQDAKATVAISDTRNRQVYRFFLDPKSC
ncbi:MAG: hypothetical protein AAF415_17415 [Pseudomonadota bacterium]